LGSDPFGASLDEVVRGEEIEGRRCREALSNGARDRRLPHPVLSRSESEQLEPILALERAPNPYLSDAEDAARRRGHDPLHE